MTEQKKVGRKQTTGVAAGLDRAFINVTESERAFIQKSAEMLGMTTKEYIDSYMLSLINGTVPIQEKEQMVTVEYTKSIGKALIPLLKEKGHMQMAVYMKQCFDFEPHPEKKVRTMNGDTYESPRVAFVGNFDAFRRGYERRHGVAVRRDEMEIYIKDYWCVDTETWFVI